MIIETQDGRELPVEKLHSVVSSYRFKDGKFTGWHVIGVIREQFETLGKFFDRKRADEVHKEIQEANRAGQERFKIPEE